MLATIRDDSRNVLNMQHITQIRKESGHYLDIAGGGHKKIKGPAHMVESGQHLRTKPTPTHRCEAKSYDNRKCQAYLYVKWEY